VTSTEPDFFNLDPEAFDPARAHLPLMLLDIDGVLNASRRALFAEDANTYSDVAQYTVPADDGREFIFWTSPTLIAELCDLHESGAVEIAWLTTWQHQAKQHVAPTLGLPEFPVAADSRGRFSDYHWKQRAAEEALQLGRPVIWIDDTEITGEAQAAYRKSSIPYMLVSPDSTLGLTRVHMAEVREFLALQAASN
jgi:hypothetical protein